MPAVAIAQPTVGVGVDVNVGADTYDTVAPGDPVESVDVFYDQLAPYGAWVDEPEVGRVFVPETADYVPYTTGHWQYTNLGFVWVSNEPHAWATAHYGRWAYSSYYGRWYWMPDTQWGPAWVEWRQAGDDFGWAPLPPEIIVRRGWQPPVESWHYCGAAHVLDVDVHRYYEPRTRVVQIHREARPIEHYSTVSNVRVVVGPPAAALRARHVAVRPVKVEPRAVGRWSPTEARAQVTRAREHQATFEIQNQRRIERDAKLREAHVKVIESHPEIKVQANARVQAAAHAAPARVEPGRPATPDRAEPQRSERGRPATPDRAEPQRAAPGRPATPERAEPQRAAPGRPPTPDRAEPQRAAPRPVDRAAPAPVERAAPRPPPRERAEPAPRPTEREPTTRPAPVPRAPAPRPEARPPAEHAEPAPPRQAPAAKPPAERDRDRDRKEQDRKEPERR